MRYLFSFLATIIFPLAGFSQGEDNNWIFGGNSGVDGAGISFAADPPTAMTSSIHTLEGCASISDAAGNLLMYSDGNKVWNGTHAVMPDGSGLITTDPSSSTQASVIVPIPGSTTRYYVFSLEDYGSPGRLYASVVDMTLDGGLGNIVTSESPVLLDSALDEKMTTVAGDCEDIWLVVHSRLDNEYKAFRITSDGIDPVPVISTIDTDEPGMTYNIGVIKFSPDRTKMGAALYFGYSTGDNCVELYDFDPASGIISGRIALVDAASDYSNASFYGICFSPDNSKIYASSTIGGMDPENYILQFDLSLATTADIIASATNIADESAFFGDMRLAKNGKIYVAKVGTEIASIDSPDLAGTACSYNSSAISLAGGSDCTYGITNVVTLPIAKVDSNEILVHDTTTCAFLTLSGREGATAYLWNTGATTETIIATTPGTYWVRSKNGCFSLDTFHINVDSITPPVIAVSDTIICAITNALPLSADVTNIIGTTYEWGPGLAIVSGDGTPNAVVNPMVSREISITATNHFDMCSASASDTISIYVFDESDVNIITPDTTICQYSEIPIWTMGPDIYSYNWAPETGLNDPFAKTPILTGATSAPYVLTTLFHNCEAFDTIYINVEPAPVVNIGKDLVVCDYDTLHLFAQTSPADFGPYTYDWDPGIYMSDSTSVKPIFQSYYPYSGYVIATATTPAGCSGADTMNMTVHSSSFMQVTPADTGVCPPAMVQFNASNAITYKWIPDYGLSSDSIPNPIAMPVSSTEYLLLGTSTFGCIDSQYVNLEVYPNAVADLPDSVQIWPGESYQINPGGNALYYSWFPSSGLSNPNIADPVAQPEVRTRYFYTATTEHGCSMTDSIDILVNTESILDMPNAFVPGNGKNNIFKVSRRGIANLKSFAVFNRWGNKVFETANLDEGWDGSFNGKPQPAGVYIYNIEALTPQGKTFSKQGNVTLLR